MNQKEMAFVEALKARGERVSSPRLQMFRVLLRKAPLTSAAFVDQLKKQGIDASTGYRNLTLFREMGIIHDFVSGGRRLIELSPQFAGDHHHHMWCVECGKLTDFDDEVIEASISASAKRNGFRVKNHQLEIAGVCESCSGK